jgi:hypothetical protein
MKPKAVILLILTIGSVGGRGRVVKVTGEEYLVPLKFIADTLRVYAVLGETPVNVTCLFKLLSVEGVATPPFRE